MNGKITTLLLAAAVVTDVALEVLKIPVPSVVMILTGFCVRHVLSSDTNWATPTQGVKS